MIKFSKKGSLPMNIILAEMGELRKHKYNVYVCLKHEKLCITTGVCKNASMKYIGSLSCDGNLDNNRKEFARRLSEIVNDYYKGKLMCKTRAIETYGKNFVKKMKPTVIACNPHFRRFSAMKLYNTDVLDYKSSKM